MRIPECISVQMVRRQCILIGQQFCRPCYDHICDQSACKVDRKFVRMIAQYNIKGPKVMIEVPLRRKNMQK
ncbi:unnamed protein product [Dracunculus medinensis]|uniref:DUF3795 domain-containing protein n=1 Tax=Dracunculus medinensis TaxID=318479 RepID=A0A0N4URZ6_DRAME|nr:unnamed protein product [Dracunculus medinensis]